MMAKVGRPSINASPNLSKGEGVKEGKVLSFGRI